MIYSPSKFESGQCLCLSVEAPYREMTPSQPLLPKDHAASSSPSRSKQVLLLCGGLAAACCLSFMAGTGATTVLEAQQHKSSIQRTAQALQRTELADCISDIPTTGDNAVELTFWTNTAGGSPGDDCPIACTGSSLMVQWYAIADST